MFECEPNRAKWGVHVWCKPTSLLAPNKGRQEKKVDKHQEEIVLFQYGTKLITKLLGNFRGTGDFEFSSTSLTIIVQKQSNASGVVAFFLDL